MVKRGSRLLLCVLLVFILGMGCSTVAPNHVAPSQSSEYSNGDKNLYKNPEYEHNEHRMD